MTRGQLAFLAGLAAVATLFLLLFEVSFEEIPYDSTPESSADPLLALGRFTEEMGVEFVPLRDLEEPGDQDEIAILILGESSTPERFLEPWTQWVEHGGRLWMVGTFDGRAQIGLGSFFGDEPEPVEVSDPLLEAFGFEAHEGTRLSAGELEIDEQFFEIADGTDRWVAHADEHMELFDLRGSFCEIPYGEGSVVYLASGSWLRNDSIESNEHIELFWHLVERHGIPRTLRVFELYGRFDLVGFLLGPGLSFFAIAFLALAFMIARRGMRLGPVVDELSTRRREFGEHLEATGAFLWQYGDRAALLRRAEEAVRISGDSKAGDLPTTARKVDARTFVHRVRALVRSADDKNTH